MTDKYDKTAATVITNTKNLNGETIYNAIFFSEPNEIFSNNEGEEIYKLYEARNRSKTFNNNKTDEYGITKMENRKLQ